MKLTLYRLAGRQRFFIDKYSGMSLQHRDQDLASVRSTQQSEARDKVKPMVQFSDTMSYKLGNMSTIKLTTTGTIPAPTGCLRPDQKCY